MLQYVSAYSFHEMAILLYRYNICSKLILITSKIPISGGYTTGSKELIDLLRQRARPYLFSNSLPPPVVGCASKVRNYLCPCCMIRTYFICFVEVVDV